MFYTKKIVQSQLLIGLIFAEFNCQKKQTQVTQESQYCLNG